MRDSDPVPAQPQSEMIVTANGPVEVVVVGTGRPCLVLHGGHGSCFDPFGLEEVRRAGMMAVVPSRPGYGRTDIAVGRTPAAAADTFVAMMRRLDLSTYSVLGISAGGPTALSLAARHPDVVDRLVLESAVADVWLRPNSAKYRMARVLFHPRWENKTWRGYRALARLAPGLAIRSLVPSLSTRRSKEVLAELDESDCLCIIDMISRQRSGRGFVQDLEAQVPTFELERITAPTLVVHSIHDGAVSISHARRAGRIIDHAQLVELDTWGHLIWLGSTANQIVDDVAEFLRADPAEDVDN